MKGLRRLMQTTLLSSSILVATGMAGEGMATRLVRFESNGNPAYGVVEGDRVVEIEGDLYGDWKKTDRTRNLEGLKILIPTEPSKVLALAGNYKDHLGDIPVPGNPEIFYKLPTTLIAHGEQIVIPPGTEEVHPELELVVVIGKKTKNVSKDNALDHVLGVTCGNDVSARDWQRGDRQWWRAKGADTFGPVGPFIATGIDYGALDIELRVNGEVRQKSDTSHMIFGVAEIVSFVSRFVTLEPGDLIYTGTPGKTRGISPGDTIEVEIEGIGTLKNTVAK
jgi:2-keto-4-pentenoate hydratase/2-oxohepta-3-ene-1,7-dioic acid hydratase in catechol pathway